MAAVSPQRAAAGVAGGRRPPPDYGSSSFWDDRYRKVREPWEWLEHYWDVSDLIEAATRGNRACRILHAGCGTSLLAEHMYDAGYRNIVNFDISPAAIELMSARNLERPQMRWIVMDATRMDLADECFDLVFDKTVLDSFACADTFDQLSAAYMKEVVRVLRPGGAFVCVSFNAQNARLRELTAQLGLTVRKHTRTSRGSKLFFVYVCRKTPKGDVSPPHWQEDADEEEDEEEEQQDEDEEEQKELYNGDEDEVEEDGTADAATVAAPRECRDETPGIASFICLDQEGNGAEIWGSLDARVGDVVDRAAAVLQSTFRPVDRELQFLAMHCNYNHRQRHLGRSDVVPPELFFVRAYGAAEEPPVAQIRVAGARFGARNGLLEARVGRVRRLVQDLNAGFSGAEFQRRRAAAADRGALEAAIRDVQLGVMARHGFPVEGASPRALLELVLQMKGFNGSAMFAEEVSRAVARTFILSGFPEAPAIPTLKPSGSRRQTRDARS